MERITITNASIGERREFTTSDGLQFTEAWRQEYGGNNCVFAAGLVEGHPVDSLYLAIEKDGEQTMLLLLRPDEASAIVMALTGAMWTQQIETLPDEEES